MMLKMPQSPKVLVTDVFEANALRYSSIHVGAGEETLGHVGLSTREKHRPAELSKGQQQRVAFARALAGSPKLLANESNGSLHVQMARVVMELLGGLRRDGTTIVVVSHGSGLAERSRCGVHLMDGQTVDVAGRGRLQSSATQQPLAA
jgi:putative ABC transport system ATP-binding protein